MDATLHSPATSRSLQNGSQSIPAVFTTKSRYSLPSQKFMIPAIWRRYHLSQLINKSLALSVYVPFDFILKGEILKGSLLEWCKNHGVGEEETIEIEYVESILPQKMSEIPHEDWVSSVSCKIASHVLTSSYDGSINLFNYSRTLINKANPNAEDSTPLSSLCVVPSDAITTSEDNQGSDQNGQSYLIASASHNLMAHLTLFTLASPSHLSTSTSSTLATLTLHTSPLSSVSASSSGTHLLTASWDGLVGVWSTSIPSGNELDHQDRHSEPQRKKRRKEEEEALANTDSSSGISRPKVEPVRKAPIAVLKSHIGRVSNAVFGNGDKNNVAYSCGFDSTVRAWDVENGLCMDTLSASEKPMLDLTLLSSADGTGSALVLSASTDRTVTLFDIRVPSASTSRTSFLHPATPACLVSGPGTGYHFASGAYDGIVRIWDVRSPRGAVASFHAWSHGNTPKRVLALDWEGEVIAVGGEGGLEMWRVNQGTWRKDGEETN